MLTVLCAPILELRRSFVLQKYYCCAWEQQFNIDRNFMFTEHFNLMSTCLKHVFVYYRLQRSCGKVMF